MAGSSDLVWPEGAHTGLLDLDFVVIGPGVTETGKHSHGFALSAALDWNIQLATTYPLLFLKGSECIWPSLICV